MMKYHDYSLEGYSVRDQGATITLHLILGQDVSDIKFSNVILYHFIHTGGSIITDIHEAPVSQVLAEKKEMISEWWRQHGGIQHWDDAHTRFCSRLASLGYRAWSVVSAMGFEGFIIGKRINQK